MAGLDMTDDFWQLPIAVTESVNEALAQRATLRDIGAEEDDFGQYIFPNARVIIYPVGQELEIDIVTDKGAFGFDIPKGAMTIKLRDVNGGEQNG